ncbi:MAG: glycoside hydrolase [Phycisphaerae bacterium]|nr:glycoside hydrolase [Phycisphaerae bacterium]
MRQRTFHCSILCLLFLSGTFCSAQTIDFKENWAYLMKGEEKYITGMEPLTDIGYFSARVNDIGRLDTTVPRPTLIGRLKNARIHLVISAPASKTLMYFCLNRDKQLRSDLISDILRMSGPFDGVQIDFEVMRAEERSAYLSFLSEIKRKLPNSKVLSVAVPARTRVMDDAFPYSSIATIADRVIIMAYDEHYRSGPPGPVASIGWCREVCDFARKQIPGNKLIMGLPLYGRVWQREEVARALKYADTLALWKNDKPMVKREIGEIPFFEIKRQVNAVAYFEDLRSLTEKLSLYKHQGVTAVGFWRIGQGPSALWSLLAIQ